MITRQLPDRKTIEKANAVTKGLTDRGLAIYCLGKCTKGPRPVGNGSIEAMEALGNVRL